MSVGEQPTEHKQLVNLTEAQRPLAMNLPVTRKGSKVTRTSPPCLIRFFVVSREPSPV